MSVKTASNNETQILKIKLLLSMNLISEDEALNAYEEILRATETLKITANEAREHILELGPPRLLEPTNEMNVALVELRALAADLKKDPKNKTIAREIARVNAEELGPASAAWYTASVGQMDAIKVGDPLLCTGSARIESLGPRNMGVAVASVTVEPWAMMPT